MRWRGVLSVLEAWTMVVLVSALDDEAPRQPVCRRIAKNALPFCSMINYHAVVDESDVDGSLADDKAKFYYDNVNIVLQRFGCQVKYSLYNCDDCRDAYKYWICSVKFPKCGAIKSASTPLETAYTYQICPHALVQPGLPVTPELTPSTCEEGKTGQVRTCLSLCEDVVRKCPYVLNFLCPSTETAYFSTDITTCNKLDRETNPDRPGPWPGTFATA